jgi:acetyltransferase
MRDSDFDPAFNFLQQRPNKLDRFFKPQRIAVIGATDKEGSVGRTLMQNLLSFRGELIPVNPNRETVFNIRTLPEVPENIDLAILVTPAHTVPLIIEQCVKKKVPAAIIISAGFKEMGKPGIALESQIMQASRGKMRMIGPNCLGIMNPSFGLNATFAADMAKVGNIAFISQSGALCTAVLDWSLHENVGFSAFVSIGSMLDVNWADLIDYFGNDDATKSILIYMESIGDPRAFLSAAREVALTKPIILIKAGRSSESALAAASHTGSLAGRDDAFNAALKRVGVLRVDTIADLFGMAEVLGKQPIPKGPHLTILTNAGGPGVIATDALILNGGKLAKISPESMDAYNAFLPAPWSHNNPIDILGDASSEVYAKTIKIAAEDPNSDGLLVILTPQDMTDPVKTAEALQPFAKLKIPLLASWMGANRVEKGREILASSDIPSFEFPDMACSTFATMWKHSDNLQAIYEMPSTLKDFEVETKIVEEIIRKARHEKRTILDEYESKRIIEAYQIPTVTTRVAKSDEEAVQIASQIGFPVVLKLYSHTITHKTEVGGVKLNLSNIEEVKKAYHEIRNAVNGQDFQGVTVQPMVQFDGYELILGSTIDEQFGPILLFGTGGQLVEVYKDRALALPPLTTTLAKRFMEQTKVYVALQGVRGKKAVNIEELKKILVRFSQLIVDQKWIKECDINPLLASGDQIIALDARIILHDADTVDFPKPAIAPYPNQYVEKWKEFTFRPIRPDDEAKMKQFHQELSQETVRQRYLKAIQYEERVAHERLQRICFNDYDREIAIVAEYQDQILGIIRLSKDIGTQDASLSMTVKDAWQHRGIGTKLLQKALEVAKLENIEHIFAHMLKENHSMQKLLKRFLFTLKEEDNIVVATL